jgi:hypothetical protein
MRKAETNDSLPDFLKDMVSEEESGEKDPSHELGLGGVKWHSGSIHSLTGATVVVCRTAPVKVSPWLWFRFCFFPLFQDLENFLLGCHAKCVQGRMATLEYQVGLVLFCFGFVLFFQKKKKKKSYAKARLILDQEDKAANRRAALVCKAHDVLFKPKAGTTGVHLKTGAEFVDVFKGVKMSTFALNDKYLYVGETGLGAKDWLSKHALHWFVVF